MGTLMIKRGHDGPARQCIWKRDGLSLSTPLFVAAPTMPPVNIHYVTLTRDEIPPTDPFILVIPSLIETPSPVLSSNTALIIAPTLTGIDGLDAEAAHLVLKAQLARIREWGIDGEHFAIHVPSSTTSNDLQEVITASQEFGIHAAVFHLDGSLGPRDLQAVLLRSQLPRNWLTIATGRIEPSLIPVLYYLGFDMLDVSYAEAAALAHQRLWRMGSEAITSSLDEARYCSCYACRNASPEIPLYSVLMAHNLEVYRTVLSEAIQASEHGKLRWLIESLTHTSPAMTAFLRRIDASNFDFVEEFTPTTGSEGVPLIGPESYNAPAIKRWRNRLVERYTPPPNKRLVLLLPCSARKPYSDSRSHRKFIEIIENSLGPARRTIAETIITSPLGVIPRELERVYPVANYDIPVTGVWDAEEIHIAAEALIAHMKKFPTDAVVVAHMTGGYAEVVQAAQDQIAQTIIYTVQEGSATSREALAALADTLGDMRETLDLKGGRPQLLEETLRATADFQFGAGAGDILVPKGSRVTGKLYRTVICRDHGEQLASFIAESGLLSLTLEGGRRLAEHGNYWVRFDGEVLKGGSLFAVAVTDADLQIRPGDEVIVLNQSDEVVGVGRSEMSGREMCDFTNGRAVSIRHRRK
ncbi:MAG: DUF5591 domain-containing protein [Candidatus Thorarchaeota archaeon]|nr:DUF5591 domain-containing protein [Candidatus Thorarchaeota archaeon]